MCFVIQKKWLNVKKGRRSYSEGIFWFYSTMQKVNISSFGHSAAMFGTFVYSIHDAPIGCVCCQLSLLLVDSWHG